MKINNFNYRRGMFIITGIMVGLAYLNTQPDPADQAYAKELFSNVSKAKSSGYSFTQSQAHMSVPSIQEKIIKDVTNIATSKDIVEACLKNEQTYKNDYYVFYTAIPNFHVLQDITRKIHKRAIEMTPTLADKEFQFLRYDYQNKAYSKYPTVTDFLVGEISRYGIIYDRDPETGTILVSTNLALFANAGFTGESTWYFFNNVQPWAAGKDTRKWLLTNSLKTYGYSEKFVDQIINLEKYLEENVVVDGKPATVMPSDLFQIFIPKKNVDKIGYLSWRVGIPFDTEFILNAVGKPLGKTAMTFGVGDQIEYKVLDDTVRGYIDKFIHGDKDAVANTNAHLARIKAGNFRISRALDRYKSEPDKIKPSINWMQGRLLVTNDMLLNPDSGIMIFRYNKIPSAKDAQYKEELKKVITAMEQDRIGQLVQKGELTATNVEVTQRLFKKIEEKKSLRINLTQTEAHASIPYNQEKIMKLSGLAKHQNLIDEVIKAEEKYQDSYWVLYSSVPYMRVLQDVTRELYKEKVGNVGALAQNAFQFLRYTYNDPIYNAYKTSNEFLNKEFTTNGIVDDNVGAIKAILLSANLALFGNASIPGESTWNYFTNPQSWVSSETIQNFLSASLTSFGYKTTYIKDLIALQDSIRIGTGDIFQIFVPKEKIDQATYLSWRQGIPFDESFIKSVLERTAGLGQKPDILKRDIDTGIARFKAKYKQGDSATRNQVGSILKKIASGEFKVSSYLEKFVKDPESVEMSDFHQGRFIITNDVLLNPKSGILIFRYSGLSPALEQTYQAKFDEIMTKIKQDKIGTETTTPQQQKRPLTAEELQKLYGT